MAASPNPRVRSTPSENQTALIDDELASIRPCEDPQPACDFDPEPPVLPNRAQEEPPDSDEQWEGPPFGDDTENAPKMDSRKRGVDLGFFSKFPCRLFGSGLAQKLGASACVLYVALCEHANRNDSNTFTASDKTLAWETALSPRTIKHVRVKLLENRLVQYSRQPGQNYTYTLVRQKLAWFKPKDRPPRLKLKPRGIAARREERQP